MVDFDFKKVLRNICLCHANLSITLLDNPHLRIVGEHLLEKVESRTLAA